jgi:hypothetical protein
MHFLLEKSNILQNNSENSVENPLIWPLLAILRASQQSCKIHNLASELQIMGLLPDLDDDVNKALFKRNFLLMNALYQLQEILLPDHWLQVQAMDIQLLPQFPTNLGFTLEQDATLRNYYLDWGYFDTSSESIEKMFTRFWSDYDYYLGKHEHMIDKTNALQIFELEKGATKQDIRHQWRKLALKWHPDRSSGNALKFREVCGAWQKLRS